MARGVKLSKNKDIHTVLYVFICILCVASSLLWESTCYCYWKFLFEQSVEMHSAPAFAVIYLCLFLVCCLEGGPPMSVCILFDFTGFTVHLVTAILQLWAYCAQSDVMDRLRRTGKNELLWLDEKKGSCHLNLSFALNIIASVVILADMLLFLSTHGSLEEAAKRPHNIGDNMLDAFQDFHFWFKLTAFHLMLFSTLSLVLAPYQCTARARWFQFVELNAAPAFLFIFLCLLLIYPFGEYPSTFISLSLDIIGAILIGLVGFIQLLETYRIFQTRKRKCYFSGTAIINWLIVICLLLDAAIYIIVDIALGIEKHQRRYQD